MQRARRLPADDSLYDASVANAPFHPLFVTLSKHRDWCDQIGVCSGFHVRDDASIVIRWPNATLCLKYNVFFVIHTPAVHPDEIYLHLQPALQRLRKLCPK